MVNISTVINYYTIKSNQVLKFINQNNNLTVEQVIESGKELEILEYKITVKFLDTFLKNYFSLPFSISIKLYNIEPVFQIQNHHRFICVHGFCS